jgi:mRNA interferase RelE/StbE
MKEWIVVMSEEARYQLTKIKDRRIQTKLYKQMAKLAYEPEKQGRALKNELTGFRRVKAVGQRYRIIYKMEEDRVLVTVVCLGIRKEGDKRDVYEAMKKLMRAEQLRKQDQDS